MNAGEVPAGLLEARIVYTRRGEGESHAVRTGVVGDRGTRNASGNCLSWSSDVE